MPREVVSDCNDKRAEDASGRCYCMHTTLITPQQLAAQLERPGLGGHRLPLRSRAPALGRAAAYASGHIPDALYAHLDHDLSGPAPPRPGGIRCRRSTSWPTRLGRLGYRCARCRWSPTTRARERTPRGCGGCCAGWGTRAGRGTRRRLRGLAGGAAAAEHAPPTRARRGASVPQRPPAHRHASGAESRRRARERGARAAARSLLVDARSADRFAGRERDHRPCRRPHPGRAQPSLHATTWTPHGRFLAAASCARGGATTLGGGAAGRS